MNHTQLESLSNPNCFPDNPGSVKIIQTHISVVCLTDDFAYKIKKPVKFRFLDFSTLELRKHFCREEVRLNRRLCPEIYLDVTPVYQTANGTLTLRSDEDGEIVDYAVSMKRLPEELEMDRLLQKDLVSPDQIRNLARIVAGFHGACPRSDSIKEAGSPENQRDTILDNFAETYPGGVFDPLLYSILKEKVLSNLDALIGWLAARSREGCVVEGHGDLHSGNIFLTNPPAIFDCIEFSSEIRCGDVAVENALLVMDLIYSGHPDLAEAYLAEYGAVSGDTSQNEQMPILISYVAMMRAKVAALSVAETEITTRERDKAAISAKLHLELAAAGLLMNRNLVIQVCGLPGGGKSYLCEALTRRLGWRHFSSDPIRKELAGYPAEAELPEEYYLPEFSRLTYAELQDRAGKAMGAYPVLADANFGTEAARNEFSNLPDSEQCIIWIECDETTVRERLLHRSDDPSSASDAGLEVYRKLEKTFEPPCEAEGLPVLRIDGENALDEKINQILCWLLKQFL